MRTLPSKQWTIAEAKAKLSEVLRKAALEGPQTIGTKTPFVVVSKKEWEQQTRNREKIHLGKWLVENLPCDVASDVEGPDFELPARSGKGRTIDFANL